MRKFLLILGIVSFFILTISLLTSSCKTKEGVDSTLTPTTPPDVDTNVSLGAPPSISTTVNAALSQLNTINGGSTAERGSSVPIVAATANPADNTLPEVPTIKADTIAPPTIPAAGKSPPAAGAVTPTTPTVPAAGAATPAAGAATPAAGAATPAAGKVPNAAGAATPAAGKVPSAAGAAVAGAAVPVAGKVPPVTGTTEGFQNLSSPTVLQPTLYY